MTGPQARALVEARLGRPAQDHLEASVVLEAWGGLSPRSALALGSAVIAETPPHLPVSFSPEPDTRSAPDHRLGLFLAVVAAAMAVLPLAGSLGQAAVTRAWHVALPLTLTLQWTLGRRYTGGGNGLARLRQGWPSGLVLTGLAAGAAMAAPGGGLIAAGLVVLWTAATLLAARGWGAWCAAAIAACFAPLGAGWVSPSAALLAGVVITVVGTAVAVTTTGGEGPGPSPWRRAVPSGVAGGGVGLLFVIGAAPRFGVGGFLILLVPSLVGGLLGGQHLSRLWEGVPRRLAGTSVQRRSSAGLRAMTVGVLAGSVVRLIAATAGMSLALLAMASLAGRPQGAGAAAVLSVTMLGVIVLIVTALDTFGRPRWAVAAVGAACAGHQLMALTGSAHGPMAMFAALVAGVAVAAWPMADLVREPDRVLAIPA